MNNKHILIFAILILFAINAFIFVSNKPCIDTDYVNATIEIVLGERRFVGFNTESDSLKFGMVSPGASVKREIKIGYSKGSTVEISAEGSLSPWLVITPNKLDLTANQQKSAFFEAYVPNSAQPGKYSAKVKFCFSISLNPTSILIGTPFISHSLNL